MKWPTQQLNEVADFRLGKMLDEKKNRGDLMPYLANVNVRWGEFDLSELREMRFEDHEVDTFGLRHGDIVMCEGGEPGRCAIWKEQLPGMMIQKAIHRIRPHACLNHEFLYYTFLYMGKTGRFSALFTGATIKHLPREKLALLEVAVPPLPVQKSIGSLLSAYDDLIENNRRRMALLEESARLLYQEWFVRLRFPGHEHVQIKNGVPEGWERKSTTEVIDINPRTKLSDADEHTWVEMGDLSTNSMVVQEYIQREGRSGSKFMNGDTLFARITPCLENGKTAYVNFLAEGEVGRGSTEFIVLRSNSLTPEFVYCLARTYAFRENAIKSMVGSSGRQRVQESCFEKFMVVVPPRTLLEHFTDAAELIFRQIMILHKQTLKVRAARDLLLPKLMSGELVV